MDGSEHSNSNLKVDVMGAVNLFSVPCSLVYYLVRVGGVAYCPQSVKGMASPRWNCPVSTRKETCTCTCACADIHIHMHVLVLVLVLWVGVCSKGGC